jgi:predicted anti-sigma-YlaC factor YlaD
MTRPSDDDHVRPALGAFVLGHLGPGEAAAVRAHLEGCAACRSEAAALAPVADLLPLADPERVGAPAEPGPSTGLLDEVLTRIELERDTHRRRRRRSVGVRVAAVAAALTLAAVVAVVTIGSDPADGPSGEVVAMTASRPGVLGEAVIHEDPRSTWVELTTTGLAAGETYAVWLEETGTGDRSPMGTFTGVEGDLYISLYSTLPRDRAASIGVSTPDGATVMEGTIPRPEAS